MNSMPYAHPFCDAAKPPILGGFAALRLSVMITGSNESGRAAKGVLSHIFV
jgi:hypothetical protein